jgi:hypothetical protein
VSWTEAVEWRIECRESCGVWLEEAVENSSSARYISGSGREDIDNSGIIGLQPDPLHDLTAGFVGKGANIRVRG